MSKKHELTAIIYDKRGRVLSIGKNNYHKTHPLQAKHAAKMGEPYKIYLHSEISAIIRCRDISKAYKISIFRYDTKGKAINAKPCPICISAISNTPIKIIEHT